MQWRNWLDGLRNINKNPRRSLRAKKARRSMDLRSRQFSLASESLEMRALLSTFYVDNTADYTITNDQGAVGLDAGDTVTWNGTTNGGPVAGLTFGTNAFDTIQGAIGAAAASGDTINVAEGTYALSSAVSVNKQVTIKGAQAGVDARTRNAVPESIVDANALVSFAVTTFAIQSGISGAVIDGFTLQNAHGTGATGVGGVYLAAGSNGSTIQNNIIQNNNAGIFLANNSSLNQTVIQKNLFKDNNAGGTLPDIRADASSSGGGVQNVLITENRFTNTTHVKDSWGVGFDSGANTNITISNNTVDKHGRGFYFNGTTNSTISGNDITLSGVATQDRYGIQFASGSDGLVAQNNRISNSSDFGIEVIGTATNLTISKNGLVNIAKPLRLTGYVGAILDVSSNYWGTSDPAAILASFTDTDVDTGIDFTPLLDNDEAPADVGPVGFKADVSSVTVHNLGLQAGPATRIQEGINTSTSTGTVNVLAGTYDETLSGSIGKLALTAGVIANLDGSVDGVVDVGAATLNTKGSAVGTFTIGNGTKNDGATEDELSLAAAGELVVDITNLTTSDKLDVNGKVSLGNSKLTLNVAPFAYNDGDEIILIDNDGTLDLVSGTFAGLADGAVVSTNFGNTGKTARISYSGGDNNDVSIVVDEAAPVIPVTNNGQNDTVEIRVVDDTLQTLIGGVVVDARPIDAVTTLTFTGESGFNDVLTIDLSTSPELAQLTNITFNAGDGAETGDKIVFKGATGGSVATLSYDGTDINKGSITVGGLTINFDGVDKNTINITGTTDLTINFAAGDANIEFTTVDADTTQITGN